jgi:uncharacterized protein (DUF1697 family)
VIPVRIALLRGINVGGHAKVAMADLRAMVLELGLAEPQTLLQSGNLLFRSDASAKALERKLEDATAERFGFKVTYFLRDAAQWSGIIAANPFPDEAKADPGHLLVQFLRTAPDAAAVAALQAAIRGPEIVRAHGRHAYIIYPDGIGRSRLTGPMIEAKLGPATGRNWNTILKLAVLAGV